ncbi:carbohydrate ABC transporter permease [Caloranaerobacter sp. DY30410]|uniref:carbohydrate ABC transporter permease n=1 Tax=Caloranaerobacter sp. DY30410 TaxID=3238305 RepID=UPI003CFEE155
MKKILLVLIFIISLLYVFPIIYTFTNSFMTESQINAENIQIIPDEFNLQQYYSIVTNKAEYFKFFMNSVKLTVIIIVGQIVIGIFAAFAFAKMEFPGRDLIFVIYILAVLLPFQVTLVPNYLVLDKIHRVLNIKILDTHMAIILPGIFSSFGVFLLRQFVRGIPNDIIEAARIDGAGYGKILFKVVLPVIKPAVFSLVILTFIDNWNLIEQAIIFIDTPSKLPLSVFLENIYYGDYKVFYAGAVLYIVPALLIFIKGEDYLKEGLTVGGMK